MHTVFGYTSFRLLGICLFFFTFTFLIIFYFLFAPLSYRGHFLNIKYVRRRDLGYIGKLRRGESIRASETLVWSFLWISKEIHLQDLLDGAHDWIGFLKLKALGDFTEYYCNPAGSHLNRIMRIIKVAFGDSGFGSICGVFLEWVVSMPLR